MFPKAKSPSVTDIALISSPFEKSVLKWADGTKPVVTIAQELGVPVHRIESCLDSLRDAGLLDGWSAPPAAAASVSRRRALTDLGRAAALFGSAVGALSLVGSTPSLAKPNERKNKQ